MKKLFLATLCFAFLTVHGQTVDEVIQKYAANLGGLVSFNKIKTAKMTGIYTVQGNDIPMTVQVVNGKAVRSDLDAMGTQIINVYNNGKAWKQNAFAGTPTPTEVTSGPELSELKIQSSLAPVLMNYKALGHKVELIGQEEVEGIKAYKITLNFEDVGRVTTYYISTKDYSLIKSESERDMAGQIVKVESFYSDLKEFKGVKFFMTRQQKMNGEVFQTTKIESIELDVPIDEKVFDMPKQ